MQLLTILLLGSVPVPWWVGSMVGWHSWRKHGGHADPQPPSYKAFSVPRAELSALALGCLFSHVVTQ